MIRFAAALAAAAAVGAGTLQATGIASLLEPLEQRYLFSPRPVDAGRLRALSTPENGIEEVRLLTPDGVSLHGWLKRPDDWRAGQRYPLVIVYGGVRREISQFVGRSGAPGHWGWLMVNYRGFGLSEGVPTERAVLDDAKEIYDWAAARPDVDAESIVVLGRSLGSYVAVAVAAERPARAVILATPFDSFVALGQKHFPHLPVSWLVGGRFDPSALAPGIGAPALFVLAENDEVTPVENGRALASRWGGWTQTVLLAGASHYGIERRDEFWRSVRGFLATLEKLATFVSRG
ncbi:MAG TPA: CocE/NonD family hydrolase [Burkholderiales bacterium]|nr:CocE/NonD family hydrolase [Burkholderiales bacterium]